jgi:3-methyladenine DNA glycosylase Mpg
MKDTVRIVAFILGVAVLSKVPGLRQPGAVLFWLIRVILDVLKFLAVTGVAAVVLVGAIAAWGEFQIWREDREEKKKLTDRRRVGLCLLT